MSWRPTWLLAARMALFAMLVAMESMNTAARTDGRLKNPSYFAQDSLRDRRGSGGGGGLARFGSQIF